MSAERNSKGANLIRVSMEGPVKRWAKALALSATARANMRDGTVRLGATRVQRSLVLINRTQLALRTAMENILARVIAVLVSLVLAATKTSTNVRSGPTTPVLLSVRQTSSATTCR